MSKKKLISDLEASVHPALMDFFGYCYYKSAVYYKLSFHEDIKDLNLIAPQCAILTLLKASGERSQIELGSELNIDKATMVKLIDDLEKSKYVKRTVDGKDRRIKLVELTQSGEKVLKELNKIRKKNEDKFLSSLTEKERELIRVLVPKLLKGALERIGKTDD